MTRGKVLITILVVCAAFVRGQNINNYFSTLFPGGKTLVYNYYGDLKTGFPATFASRYSIKGKFHITSYTSDPNLKNAYFLTLKNAKIGFQHKKATHFDQNKFFLPVPEAAKVIEEPFLVDFSKKGELEGIKFSEHEPVWSKNMKTAWALMFQLNIEKITFELPTTSQSFVTKEKTINGECKTTYDINTKYPYFNETLAWIVTKFTSPTECIGYKPYVLKHVDIRICAVPEEEMLNAASKKVYEIQQEKNKNLVLRKLSAYGEVNFYPSYNRSNAYNIWDKTTFILENVTSSEFTWPEFDFTNASLITDFWLLPKTYQTENTIFDVTNGRRVVDQKALITEVQQLLNDAANYLQENHIEAENTNWQYSNIINNIFEAMKYFKTSSFQLVFSEMQNTTTSHKTIVRSLFLGIVPQLGTMVANIFLVNTIAKRKITDFEAIEIFAKLPFNVRTPSENRLSDWKRFVVSSKALSPRVHKASILAFGTMAYRTFEYATEDNEILERYLNFLYDGLINEPTYEMKVVWLSAIHNVQVGNIHKLLSPIVRGDIILSERPDCIRLLSIGAMLRSLHSNYDHALVLLWPIMSDRALPLNLRLGAYNILLQQSRTVTDFLRIHWFMITESNQHLYNFHLTTIRGFASSAGPCSSKMREFARKILLLTPVQPAVPQSLSALYEVNTINHDGNGLQLKITVVNNELTDSPEIIYLQQFNLEGFKVTNYWALYLQFDGITNTLISKNDFQKLIAGPITETFILDFIKQFATFTALTEQFFLDFLLFYRDQIIMVENYNTQSFINIYQDFIKVVRAYITPTNNQPLNLNNNFDSYHVYYQKVFEQHLISDMGMPIVLKAQSPTVYSQQIKNNNSTNRNTINSLVIDTKAWLFEDHSASVYNPIIDSWHSVKESSIITANISLQIDSYSYCTLEFMRYTFPRYWNAQMTKNKSIVYHKSRILQKEKY